MPNTLYNSTLLERITNILLLNASFIDNLGLMHGKMGICIFFYHLARKTNNKIYEDYAGELLDEITEEINEQTPWDFENGLSGIGWGIEYLVQNGFVEGDTDEVLFEIDNRLFRELNFSPPVYINLYKGTLGICAYFQYRIRKYTGDNQNIPALINQHILIQCIDEIERHITKGYKFITNPDGKNNSNQITSNIHPNKQIQQVYDHVASTVIIEKATRTVKNPESSLNTEIAFDLPCILLILAEMHRLDLYNFKVQSLIFRLLRTINPNVIKPSDNINEYFLLIAIEGLFITNTISNKKENNIDIKALHARLKNLFINSTESYNNLNMLNKLFSRLDGVLNILLMEYSSELIAESDSLKPENENFERIIAGLCLDPGNYNLILGIKEGLAGIGLSIILSEQVNA